MPYIIAKTCIKYLGYKENTEDDSSENIEKTTEHSSVSIEMITEQHSTCYHHNNNDSSGVDDDRDVSCIVEGLDLDLSRLEGQEDRDELCYEDVGIESNDPE